MRCVNDALLVDAPWNKRGVDASGRQSRQRVFLRSFLRTHTHNHVNAASRPCFQTPLPTRYCLADLASRQLQPRATPSHARYGACIAAYVRQGREGAVLSSRASLRSQSPRREAGRPQRQEERVPVQGPLQRLEGHVSTLSFTGPVTAPWSAAAAAPSPHFTAARRLLPRSLGTTSVPVRCTALDVRVPSSQTPFTAASLPKALA